MYDLEQISQELTNQIDTILDDFGIKYNRNNNSLSMPCPIHGGDNPGGLSILQQGVGNWQCFTHQCHEEYDPSLIGFIQALLSTQYNRKVNKKDAIEWSARFTGVNNGSPQEYRSQKEKTKFIHLSRYINPDKTYTNNFVPREIAREALLIPAPQFIDGTFPTKFSKAVLIEYDIGLCTNPNKSMYNRVVVPLYDDSGKYMVGCSGRTIYPKCEDCNKYHAKNTRCPIGRKEKVKYVKWLSSSKFNAESYLYNFWKAKEHINKDNIAILVEGPGDVWRLEEAGIHYGLALLGTKFTDSQCEILERTHTLHLIIATDNDPPGEKSRKIITKRCERLFNIHHVQLDTNDIGDMTANEVRDKFKPILEGINYVGK